MISSLSNPLVKQARALRQHKTRVEKGLFIVEGIHHVGEAAEAGWDIDTIFYDPRTLMSKYALDLVSRLSSKVQQVSPPVMEALAGKDNPVGLVAVAHQRQIALSYFVEHCPSLIMR